MQELYGMVNETFLIYHADEFKGNDSALALRNLLSLPGVQVRDLRGWHDQHYTDQEIKRLQVCRIVLLLDL
jgi:hypothetical protein